MAYTNADDWSDDLGRHNPEVHYRLYVSPRDNRAAVICAQDFDYPDYDARRILSPEVFDTESAAERALLALVPAWGEVMSLSALDSDMRARLMAAASREAARSGDTL